MKPKWVIAIVCLTVCGATPSAEWAWVEPRELVEQSDLVVVATLVDPGELTAGDIDYGRGVLRIHEVVWPAEIEAKELLLRWSNPTGEVCPRVDPRPHADKPAVWLLTRGDDTTVQADYPGRILPLDQVDLGAWILQLWPFTEEPTYEQKVLALEAYARASSEYEGEIDTPEGGIRDR